MQQQFSRHQELTGAPIEALWKFGALPFRFDLLLAEVDLAHAIYRIAVLVAADDSGSIQAQLLERVEALELAGAENVAAIRTWRSGLGPQPWHYRVHDALNATENTVAEIARIVRERHVLHGRDSSL